MKTNLFLKRRIAIAPLIALLLAITYVLSGVVNATAAVDTFTDTAGTQLESHVSNSGNTWSKNTAVSSGNMSITDANRLRGNSSSTVIYTSNYVPSSPDYEVSADIYIASASFIQIGLGGRTGTSAFTGYYVLLQSGKLVLYRGGNATPLGEYVVSPVAGSTYALKLAMQGNNITVLWNDAPAITVTATGANIISTAGSASIYSQGSFTNTTGAHLDNFSADNITAGPLTAGVLSEVSHQDTSATVSWTASSGGTLPRTSQLQRSISGSNSWSNVSNAASSPAVDTGLSPSTAYDYRVAYTDMTSSVVYSNTLTVTTSQFCTPSTAYRCVVRAESGLRYYWPMDDFSGATILKPLVGGIPVNLTGATTAVTGKIDGTATRFNGTSDFGATASSLSLGGLQKVVVEALIKSDTYGAGSRVAWEAGPTAATTSGGFYLGLNETGSPDRFNVLLRGSTGFNYALYDKPSVGNWHHIAAVYNLGAPANEVDLYIDGSLQAASSRPASSNNSSTFINNILYIMSRAGTSFFGQGSMQHLAIYDDLSSVRIAAHSQLAAASSISPGTLTEVSHTSDAATVSWSNAADGTAPIGAQLQRSGHGINSWTNVSGATASPATNTGLEPATSYDYRVAYTDATPSTVYSNVITVATDNVPMTTYSIQASDLWDNGYDNIGNPRQSSASRYIFTTNAASVIVGGTTTIYGSFPQYAHLGVRVDGVNQPPLVFAANGSQNFTLNLGAAGTTRTVEIIAGVQSKPSSTVIGSFIDSITYPQSSTFNTSQPVSDSRVVVYGDSISMGANATNPEYQGYAPLLKNDYNYNIMLEGWGYRSLHDDANTSGLRSSLVDRITGYTPSTVYLAIGTNDYGLNKWNASSFGAAYAALLDDMHTSMPSARIICQTPLVRGSESANGFGNTLSDYRNKITEACNTRSWATLVDGAAFLTTTDLADGIHPTTAGFVKYAKRMASVLASPAFTVTGPTNGLTNQPSSPYTVSPAKTNFMGDQTVSITAPDGVITATAAGGSVVGNGTGSVTVTPANNATNFSFMYTSANKGIKILTFTNGQSWKNPAQASYSVMLESDVDNDGIDNVVEDGAPNNGDGNNDGILDSQQAQVASFINPVTANYAVLAVDEDCKIISVFISAESGNATQDNSYQYKTGLMNFRLSCDNQGHTSTIAQYFYGVAASADLSLRKYNPNIGTYSAIVGGTVQDVVIQGHPALMASYQITDGGVLDMDYAVNGEIVDPVGLASVEASNGGIINPDSNLAGTGQNSTSLAFITIALLTAATGILYITMKTSRQDTVH